MENNNLDRWLQGFEKEMLHVQIEFDAFFKEKDIKAFYKIHINREAEFFSIDIINRQALPMEIIDRITAAYLQSKPE